MIRKKAFRAALTNYNFTIVTATSSTVRGVARWVTSPVQNLHVISAQIPDGVVIVRRCKKAVAYQMRINTLCRIERYQRGKRCAKVSYLRTRVGWIMNGLGNDTNANVSVPTGKYRSRYHRQRKQTCRRH